MSIIQKVKAQSITNKASAACKINMGLVYGAADVQASKGFKDYGGLIEKSVKSATDEINPIEDTTEEKTEE